VVVLGLLAVEFTHPCILARGGAWSGDAAPLHVTASFAPGRSLVRPGLVQTNNKSIVVIVRFENLVKTI
jgi:hypothetical protein